MDGALERVLELVAAGRLTAEEAGPILDALGARPAVGLAAARGATEAPAAGAASGEARNPRFARLEVRENGKRVVDLRIPISLGRYALARVPGLSAEQVASVEDAVATGTWGPILDVEDADGDGVRIVLE